MSPVLPRVCSSRLSSHRRAAPDGDPVSGGVPPGLTPNSDGTLTGTPTQVGTYEFTVQANKDVGTYQATVPVTISPATLRSGSLVLPAPGGATLGHDLHKPRAGAPIRDCRLRQPDPDRNLPPLGVDNKVTLARGAATYAIGRTAAAYLHLTLHCRRRLSAAGTR